jgi:class 3 adenylate cyclase
MRVERTVGSRNEPDRSDITPRAVRAILFADFQGFGRLRDEHFPSFVRHLMSALARAVHDHEALWCNAWGDALAAVFGDAVAAADCALSLQDALARIDYAELGLPPDLHLRIGAHVGPMLALVDPVTGRDTYWGRELTRAARIEPRTPAGQVYVTDAFAALLALEVDAPFATEYVGRITTAKDFETIPMYRLRRRLARATSRLDSSSARQVT